MKVLTIMLKTLLILYCLIIPHSYCLRSPTWNRFQWTDERECSYFVVMDTIQSEGYITQTTIVDYHNTLRSTVDPPASNMLRMEWNEDAALASKKRALKCTLEKTEESHIGLHENCGHNIYVTSQILPWNAVIRHWFSKRKTFIYNRTGKEHPEILPYVQMVRATTDQIGCHRTECWEGLRMTHHYVCTYCPIGSTFKRPYKRGKWCSNCKKRCYEGALCTNPCPFFNLWNNCDALSTTIRSFCFLDRNNSDNCAATCACSTDWVYESDLDVE